MNDFSYECTECEAEFEVLHDEIDDPEFCPFCSAKLKIKDYDEDEEEVEE